jgi:Na+-translocating ferredoxin:NAD+ oxidoreductase RnfC subunit
VPTRAFKGGVHPADSKDQTNTRAVERAPLPPMLAVPVSQHLGAACSPVVEKGDRVRRGQLIADVEAMVSAPVHSPVDGEVTAIAPVLLASGARALAVSITPDEVQDYASFVRVGSGEDSVPDRFAPLESSVWAGRRSRRQSRCIRPRTCRSTR